MAGVIGLLNCRPVRAKAGPAKDGSTIRRTAATHRTAIAELRTDLVKVEIVQALVLEIGHLLYRLAAIVLAVAQAQAQIARPRDRPVEIVPVEALL